jgi:nicotinamide mononucleotide transporter
MTPLETAAVLFTLLNVWLTVKENIWCWPTGIVGVTLYGFVNYEARLYSNTALQVIYLVLSIHGWYEWLHGGAHKTPLTITRASRRTLALCLVSAVVISAVLLLVLRATTGAALPVWDASTTAFSLVAQWMMNEKLVENWLLWLAVDIVYVPIYAVRSYNMTAALYAIFCLLAWKGYVDWRRSSKENQRSEVELGIRS